jgi:predicted nucleic acid-binding protein
MTVSTLVYEGYLLDTSVLSALSPDRRQSLPRGFAEWLLERSDRLFVPCIAVAEIEQGISKLRRAGSEARAERLSPWLDELIGTHGERILPLDTRTSRIAGQMSEQALADGRHPGFPDIAIAALARSGNLLLLTRNLKHFIPLGVACADPLLGLPD